MFSRIAHGYDRANRWMSLGTDERWRRRAVRDLVPPDSGHHPRVLDLCAGTMDSSLQIHNAYPHADVVAGDFSAGMLARGQSKLQGGAAARIHPRAMDAHELPAQDDAYDAIFCAFGVRNLSDLERATAEQARCLRPGGHLVVLEFFVPERTTSAILHALYNRLVLPFIGWAATGDLAAYRYLPRSIGRFVTTGEYTDLLNARGFIDVRVEPLTFGMACVVRAVRGAD
jgi:ubiquinone/menaquinone biosynthesis methyltransferase